MPMQSNRERTTRTVSTLSCVSWLLLLLLVPPALLGQATPDNTPAPHAASLGDSIRNVGNKELHILYIHGIASDGPGDFDSWLLRKTMCKSLGCIEPAGHLDGIEYADQDEFQLNAPPPKLLYLGEQVWKTDASGKSTEWNAAAPFVVHWKLERRVGPPIYVDEINWWPLIFSLKCRQIVQSDAALVGPSKDRIKACSTLISDSPTPGRFRSYDWISASEAQRLNAMPVQGALVNRALKNGLLDWGFSDAVMSLGPLRGYIVDGIRQLVLKSVNISPEGTRGTANNFQADQEFVIVTHSLGSYLIFDALDVTPATPQTATVIKSGDEFSRILSHTSVVYFFANQLRLLELANLDVVQINTLVSHLQVWGDERMKYLDSLGGPTKERLPPPQIIALNDSSDLLTWTVPQLQPPVEVRNLTVKNAHHWLWLLESPSKAHDNYAKNRSVVAQMLKAP